MTVLALLGPSSLLGKEIHQTLETRRDLWSELRLLATAEEEAGMLAEVDGAADFVRPVDAESLSGVDILLAAGQAAGQIPPDLGAETTPLLISPAAPVPGGLPIVAGVNLETAEAGRPLVSPHPAVVALAHLLRPLEAVGLNRAVALALQPASPRGEKAINELVDQTRSILTFTSNPPQEVFGHQLAFNLLPVAGGGDAAVADLRQVLGDRIEVALQIVQAPVFHGYAIGAFIETAARTRAADIREALATAPFVQAADDPERLGPIASAAREEVIVGEVSPAPGREGGFWLWAVLDNFTRGGALNALAIVEALVAPRH